MVDALQSKQIYFGFKFHALTTVDGFLTDYAHNSSVNVDIEMQYGIYVTNIVLFLL